MSKYMIVALLCVGAVWASAQQDEDVLRPRGGKTYSLPSSSQYTSPKKGMIYFGVEGGLNYNMFTQDVSGYEASGYDSRFTDFANSGSGISSFYNFYVDIPVSSSMGVQVNLGLDNKVVGNTGSYLRPCFLEDGTQTAAPVNGEYTDKIDYLQLGLKLRYNVTPNVFVAVGPMLHFRNNGSTSEFTETITDGECFFNFNTPQQSKTFSAVTTDSPVLNNTRVGADIGVGYLIPLDRNFFLIPRIGYQYFFTPVSADDVDVTVGTSITNRNLNSLQLGLSLMFGTDW